MRSCFCGCEQRSVHRHHVVTRQAMRSKNARLDDPRNLVDVDFRCHWAHHNRSRPYALAMLPDSVFEFARETLGAGPAYEYLRRYYAGDDARLDALLEAS